MTNLTARVYEALHATSPQTPDYVKARLRCHEQEGHSDVRLFDYADRGYLLETYRDSLGRTICHRHPMQAEESVAALNAPKADATRHPDPRPAAVGAAQVPPQA